MENVPCAFEHNVILLLLTGVFIYSFYLIYNVIPMFCRLDVLLPSVVSATESAEMESSAILVELAISPFNSVSFYFMHFGSLLLGAYVYNCYIFWWIDSFIIIKCSFSLVNIFSFRVYCFDINIEIPTFYGCCLNNISFLNILLSIFCTFKCRVCLL